MLPILAIACGSSLFYYQNFQPYMKFDLPLITFTPEEREVWNQLAQANEEGIQVLADKLFALRESGVQLSSLSAELLSLESIPEQL